VFLSKLDYYLKIQVRLRAARFFDSLFAREKTWLNRLGAGDCHPAWAYQRVALKRFAALVTMKEAIPFDAPDGQQ